MVNLMINAVRQVLGGERYETLRKSVPDLDSKVSSLFKIGVESRNLNGKDAQTHAEWICSVLDGEVTALNFGDYVTALGMISTMRDEMDLNQNIRGILERTIWGMESRGYHGAILQFPPSVVLNY